MNYADLDKPSPYYGEEIEIPDFIELIKKPENVADLFRVAAEYIEKSTEVDELSKKLNEVIKIRDIAIKIINEHGLSEEMNERCWKEIKE